jgi:hypothetical protein
MDGTNAEVFVGVDMAKAEHYAQAITAEGVELFDRPCRRERRRRLGRRRARGR